MKLRSCDLYLTLLAGAFSSVAGLCAGSSSITCVGSPKVQGACFAVRGRLTAHNGNPWLRIWPVGTHRLLGVYGADGNPESDALLPSAFSAPLDYDHAYFADFTVCPMSADRRGVMRAICVHSVRHLVSRKRK